MIAAAVGCTTLQPTPGVTAPPAAELPPPALPPPPQTAALSTPPPQVSHEPPPPEPVAPRRKPKWTDPDPIFGDSQRIDGDEAGDVIAFTFDDGPDERTTPAVLDALATYDVPATFFVVTKRITGERGAGRRALLDRIVAEGHAIGSHTVSHKKLTELAKADVEREIESSLKTLTTALGHPVGMFRAPFGALGSDGARVLRKHRLTDVQWSVDSKDFLVPDPAKLRRRVAKLIADGGRGVILFHDTKESTALALASILDDLEAMNCARLAAGEEPVLPVSLHYFLRDGGEPRAAPDDAVARTNRYQEALPARCAARIQPAETKGDHVADRLIDNHIEPH
jgi:peptidoglycan/xylan/chitin deacetylase (PgdA/CDA1 family)